MRGRDDLERAARSRMRRYSDSPVLRAKIQSYAIIKTGQFVPLIPRHMNYDTWRMLYHLYPKLIVLKGKEYSSTCELCLNAMVCLPKKSEKNFACGAREGMIDGSK